MPIVTLRLSDDEYSALKDYCRKKGMSTSELLRNAIFLVRLVDRIQDMKAFGSFIQDTLIQSVLQDVKSSLEQKFKSPEFQADLKKNLPAIQKDLESLAKDIRTIAPYKKRRGRPPLPKTTQLTT